MISDGKKGKAFKYCLKLIHIIEKNANDTRKTRQHMELGLGRIEKT